MSNNPTKKQARNFLEFLRQKQIIDDAEEKKTGKFFCQTCGEYKPLDCRTSKGWCRSCSGKYDY